MFCLLLSCFESVLSFHGSEISQRCGQRLLKSPSPGSTLWIPLLSSVAMVLLCSLLGSVRETGLSISASTCTSLTVHLASAENHGNGDVSSCSSFSYHLCTYSLYQKNLFVSVSLPGTLVLFVLCLGFLIVCGRLFCWGFIPKLPQVHISIKEI